MLSLDQAKAALALARGGTVSAAADSIGVHRSSIYNWYKSDPSFKLAIEEIRHEWNQRLTDEMRRLESLALPNCPRRDDLTVPARNQNT